MLLVRVLFGRRDRAIVQPAFEELANDYLAYLRGGERIARQRSMGVLQVYVRDADLFRDHAGAGLLNIRACAGGGKPETLRIHDFLAQGYVHLAASNPDLPFYVAAYD